MQALFKNSKASQISISVMTLIFTTTVYATHPILSIKLEKTGENKKQLNPHSSYTIDYKVTNSSPRSHSAAYIPNISGATQHNVPGRLNCNNHVILTTGQSCLLRLFISAIDIAKNKNTGQQSITSGPFVSVDGSNFSVNQPSAEESLNITVTDTPVALVANVPSLALSVNNPTLNAALVGNTRAIVFTNEGSQTATNVTYIASPAFPNDTTVTYTPSESSCSSLSPGASCTINITPGATPTTTPVTLTATSGTNTANSTIFILSYGSLYQTGYVFSIQDSTPTTPTEMSSSVSGTVVAQELQATTGVEQTWSPASEPNSSPQDALYYPVCGIYQTTTAGETCSALTSDYTPNYPSSYLSYPTCNGATDGVCNTFVLVGAVGTAGNTGSNTTFNGVYPSNGQPGSTAYSSAGLCRSYSTTDSDETTYQDWYLPSICELGYQQEYSPLNNYTSGCSTSIAPAPNDTVIIQNIQSSLLDPNPQPIPSSYAANFDYINLFWSSTEFDGTPFLSGYNCNSSQPTNTSPCAVDVWYNEFNNNHSTHVLAEQNIDNKGDFSSVVICVRTMTQPQ